MRTFRLIGMTLLMIMLTVNLQLVAMMKKIHLLTQQTLLVSGQLSVMKAGKLMTMEKKIVGKKRMQTSF